jgi:hypothetical protein
VLLLLLPAVLMHSPTVDEARPPDAAEVRQQTEQLKQAQEASAHGPQEHAMSQLQQDPQEADVPQQTQDLAQPMSPLLDECLTLWLSFWAEVGCWGDRSRMCVPGVCVGWCVCGLHGMLTAP